MPVVTDEIDFTELPDKEMPEGINFSDLPDSENIDWSGLPDASDTAISTAPEPSLYERTKEFFLPADVEKERAKAQNALLINQTFPDIPIHAAYENQDSIFEELKKRNTTIEDYNRYALPKLDWYDKVKDTIVDNPAQLVPFVASGAEAVRLVRIMNAVNRLPENNGITEQEKNDLTLLREFVDQSNRDTTFGYKVISVLSALPAFVGELALTYGVYTGVSRASTYAAKEGITKLLGKVGREALEQKLVQSGIGLTAGAIGRTAQATVAGITRIRASAIKNMIDEFELTGAEAGELQGIITDEGNDLGMAYLKAFGEQQVEVWSEYAGAPAMNLLSTAAKPIKNIMLKSSFLKAFLKANPSATISDFNKIIQKTGWSGPLGEMLEERVADIGHGLLYEIGLGDQELKWPSLEQIGVELVAFSAPTLAGKGFIEAKKTIKGMKPAMPITEGGTPKEAVETEDIKAAPALEAIPEKVSPEQAVAEIQAKIESGQEFTEEDFNALADKYLAGKEVTEEVSPPSPEAEPSPPPPPPNMKFEDTVTIQGKRMAQLLGPNDNIIAAKDPKTGKELGYIWYTKEEGGGFTVRKTEAFEKRKGIATALTNEVVAREGIKKGFTDVTPEGLAFNKAYAEKYPANVSPEFKQKLAEAEGRAAEFQLEPTRMPVVKPKAPVQEDLLKVQPAMPSTAIETTDVGHPMLEEITQREEAKRQMEIPTEKPVIVKPAKAAPKVNPETDSLATYIRKHGGFNYQKEHQKGELDRLSTKEAGTSGLLNKKGDGLTLDQMLEVAIEDGYFNENADINDLLNAIENEVYRQKKHYSTQKVWTDKELGEMMKQGATIYSFPANLAELNFKEAYKYIESAGKAIYKSGMTLKDFSIRMKAALGKHWEKFKDTIKQLYNEVKAWNERMGERGAIGKQEGFFPETKAPADFRRTSLIEAARTAAEAYKLGNKEEYNRATAKMLAIAKGEIKTKTELEARKRLEELDKGEIDIKEHLKYRKKGDVIASIKLEVDKTLGIISTRLKKINPNIKSAARKYVYKLEKLTALDNQISYDFLEGYSKLDDNIKVELSHALLDGNKEKVDKIASKYGLLDAVNKVRDMLPQERQRAIDAGFKIGKIENYWPRIVKDPEGLLAELRETKEWTAIDEAIRKIEKKADEPLSNNDKAAIADMLLRGFPKDRITIKLPETSPFKQRKLEKIPRQLLKYYMPADQSLITHIRRMNNAIEAANFFGKKKAKGEEAVITQLDLLSDISADSLIDKSIGNYIIDLKEEGLLTRDKEKNLRDILQAVFKPAATNYGVRVYKNLTYLQLLTQITPAITQIMDIALTAERAGYWKALKAAGKAVIGKSEITIDDIHLERILEEFEGGRDKIARALQKGLKYSAFSAIDRIGKESLLNAKMEQFRDWAKEGDERLNNRIKESFGKDENVDAILSEFKEGKVTDNTLFMLWNELSEIQPISKIEVPERYLTLNYGKTFYALKTYQLKLLDIYRNDVWHEIKNGNKLEGFKKLARLTIALVLLGAFTDKIKDFILGRRTDFVDLVWDNLLRLGGFSKYTLYKVRKEGLSKGLMAQFAPPAGAIDAITKDIDELMRKGEFEKGARTPQHIPMVGKLYYWWFGRGSILKKEKPRK